MMSIKKDVFFADSTKFFYDKCTQIGNSNFFKYVLTTF